MASIYDVEPQELIEKTAEELKKIDSIKPPEWAPFVKTGGHKERPPVKQDWWYVRAASILRTLYKIGPVGVSKLKTKYGGKKNRGVKPEEFRKASGNILRKILQQLEKAGLAKKVDKGVNKGRVITPKGKSMLDKVASGIVGKAPKPKIEEEKITGEKKKLTKAKEEITAKEKIEKLPTVKELVEQTKKEFTEKKPSAEEIIEEIEKEEKKEKKKIEKVPTAHELAEKNKIE